MRFKLVSAIVLSLGIWVQSSAQEKSMRRYVSAVSGLNVRNEPNTNSDILQTLPYGAAVVVLDDSVRSQFINDNGIKKEGNWVRIEVFMPQLAGLIPVTGYVHDAYLTNHLSTIPPHSLYNFTEIHQFSNGKAADELVGLTETYNFNTGQFVTIYPIDAELEKTLEQFLTIELSESGHIPSEPTNSFKIDSSWKPIKKPYDSENSTLDLEHFYLPLKDSMDSLHIMDNAGEWEFQRDYIGKVDSLNLYMVTDFPELEEVIGYDMTTGESIFRTAGVPSFNLDGTIAASLIVNPFDNVSMLSVESVQTDKYLQVDFTSFYNLGEFFWDTNSSFVFQAAPLDTVFTDSDKSYREWIRITLKDF